MPKKSPAISFYRSKTHVVEALRAVVGLPGKDKESPCVEDSELRNFLSTSKDIQLLDEALSSFNLFHAVCASNEEVRHSNFLAWLFSAGESHSFGDLFLRSFILGLFTKLADEKRLPLNLKQASALNLSDARVERESKRNKALARIDLIISIPTEKLLIVVENKLHAGKTPGQLAKYRQIIESDSQFSDYQKIFVFLTLKPEIPDDPEYLWFTYSELVAGFKKAACVQSDYAVAHAKEIFFRHYLRLINGDAEQSFNIFRALKSDRKELRHSDVIAWLLNPHETHGHKEASLRDFLLLVQNKAETHQSAIKSVLLAKADLSDFEIHREYQHIDILLVSEATRLVVAIENKWGSKESAHQLANYRELVKAQFPEFTLCFVYLSLAGEVPSAPDYIAISYADLAPLVAKRLQGTEVGMLSQTQEVAIFADQYFRLIQQQLKVSIRAKVQMPEEIEKLCKHIFSKNRDFISVLLISIAKWEKVVNRLAEDFLYSIINKHFGAKTFRNTYGVWMRFAPTDFDKICTIRSSSSDAMLGNRMIHYTFHKIPFGYADVPYASDSGLEKRGILLTLGMAKAKEGFEQLRELIYLKAQSRPEIFNTTKTEKLRGSRFSTLIQVSLASGNDFLRFDQLEVEKRIAARFARFVKFQHCEVMRIVCSEAVASFKP